MSEPSDVSVVASEAAFRALHGNASEVVQKKTIRRIDAHARRFIERCPFLVLASHGDAGMDASPRGDAPGFVRVIDDTTLLIPDRPGNRRADSMGNLLIDGRLGLLLMIPGMNETLRINGRAWLVDDAELLAPCAVRGKTPAIGIWVHVEELFFHCPKAYVRSGLWNPDNFMDRGELPSLGRMVLDQIQGRTHAADDPVVVGVDAALAEDEKNNLY